MARGQLGGGSPDFPVVSGMQENANLPRRISPDAVRLGIVSSMLSDLHGTYDGCVTVTSGASVPGDGLGRSFTWVESSTDAENGTTIFGVGPTGRWHETGSLVGGSASSGTSVTLTNQASGQLTSSTLVAASSVIFTGNAEVPTYTGIVEATGGELVKELANASSYDIILAHQDPSATAANRIITPTGSAWVIGPGKSCTVSYDTTAQRYRVQAADALFATAATSATAMDGATIDSLASAVASLVIGKTYTAHGRSARNDSGACDVLCVSGSATVDDVDVFASASDRHIRRKHVNGPVYPRSCGIIGDGVADDTTALQNALNIISKTPGRVLVLQPKDRIRVTDTIHVYQDTTTDGRYQMGGLCIQGGTARSIFGWRSGNGHFLWDRSGAADGRPMFDVRAAAFTCKNVSFVCKTGHEVSALVSLDITSAPHDTTTVVTAPYFEDCVFELESPTSGRVYKGVTIENGVAANLEEGRFVNCHFRNCDKSVSLSGAQPFKWQFTNVEFASDVHQYQRNPNGVGVGGTGVYLNTGACSVVFSSCTWRVGVGVINDGVALVNFDGMQDAEHMKSLIRTSSRTPVHGIGSPVQVANGRFHSDTYNGQCYEPTLPPSDTAYILLPCGGQSLIVDGCSFQDSLVPKSDWKIELGPWNSVELTGGIYPNANPVWRSDDAVSPRVAGSTVFHGLRTVDGTDQMTIPDRSGPDNADFEVVVSGTQTVVPIGFPVRECAVPVVSIDVAVSSGTPPSGTTAPVSGLDRTGCVATLSAAPGAGNAYVLRVRLRRPAPVETLQSAEYAAASIVRATATGQGLDGHASGWWGAALVVPKSAPVAGTEYLASNYEIGGPGSGWILQCESSSVRLVWYNGGSSNAQFIHPGAFDANDVGKAFLYVWTWTGTQMAAWTATAATGAATPYEAFRVSTPAYLAPTGQKTVIGAHNAGIAYNANAPLLGLAGGLGALTDAADVKRYFQRVARARALVDMDVVGVTTTHRWRTDASATLVNMGSAGASANVTTVSGTPLASPAGFRAAWNLT